MIHNNQEVIVNKNCYYMIYIKDYKYLIDMEYNLTDLFYFGKILDYIQ